MNTTTNQIQGIKLSELGLKIKSVLDNAFNNLNFWVIADVSSHTPKPERNYHFFQLVEKDPDSNVIITKIESKAWGAGAEKIKEFESITGQKFTNGIQVLVNVNVVYSPNFGLQLELIGIDPSFTLGNLEKQRRETLRKLVTENPDVIKLVGEEYRTRNKGLTLNSVIQTIAVISSKDSAGLMDFQHSLVNNSFGYVFNVHPYHTHVQGDERAINMRNKIIEVFKSGIKYDALVILRGGGSDTDFLIFDNYLVAQAIARFTMPVITGIGHQKNVTIADMMAHSSTKTPTKAAEFIIARNKSFEDSLVLIKNNIVIKSQQIIAVRLQLVNQSYKYITENTNRFLSLRKEQMVGFYQIISVKTKHMIFERTSALQEIFRKITTKPIVITAQQKTLLENEKNRLLQSSPIYLKHARGYLGHYVSVIEMAKPEKMLNMGFAIIKQDGKYITRKAEINFENEFDVVMKDGTIKAKS